MTAESIQKFTIFLAATFQGIFLIYFLNLVSWQAVSAVFVSIGIGYLVYYLWKKREQYRYLEFMLVTTVFGGLGMLCGKWLDLQFAAASHHAHHSAHVSVSAHLFSLETLLMLGFCIAACEVFCYRRCIFPSVHQRLLHTLGCHIFMLVGMLIGGYALSAIFFKLFESPLLIAHLSMVSGMVLGVWSGLKLVSLVLGDVKQM